MSEICDNCSGTGYVEVLFAELNDLDVRFPELRNSEKVCDVCLGIGFVCSCGQPLESETDEFCMECAEMKEK